MTVVVSIEDPAVLAKIIMRAKKEEQEPQPSVYARSHQEWHLCQYKPPKIDNYTKKDRSSQTVFTSAVAEICFQLHFIPWITHIKGITPSFYSQSSPALS